MRTVLAVVVLATLLPAGATAQARGLHVRFEAEAETRFFLLRPPEREGERPRVLHICDAPCEHWMPSGTQRIAVAVPRRAVVSDVVPLRRDGVLFAEFVDRAPIRTIGWVAFGVSLATSLALVLVPALDQDMTLVDGEARDVMLASAALLVEGAVLGVILGLQPDGVGFRFE